MQSQVQEVKVELPGYIKYIRVLDVASVLVVDLVIDLENVPRISNVTIENDVLDAFSTLFERKIRAFVKTSSNLIVSYAISKEVHEIDAKIILKRGR